MGMRAKERGAHVRNSPGEGEQMLLLLKGKRDDLTSANPNSKGTCTQRSPAHHTFCMNLRYGPRIPTKCTRIVQGGISVHTLHGWTLCPNLIFCWLTPTATTAICVSSALLITSLFPSCLLILHNIALEQMNATLIRIGEQWTFQCSLRNLVVDLVT